MYNHFYSKNKLQKLPVDPRTLLNTPKSIQNLFPINDGSYWHKGLKSCLLSYFKTLKSSISISLNINIDGIPLYKGSKIQFWPILFNIHEIEEFSPMTIGIFCGQSKPGSIESYLASFVEELSDILDNGVVINDFHVVVKIRSFICDAPARSMIKGKFCFIIL